MAQINDVFQRSEENLRMLQRIRLSRALRQGISALRNREFLPPFEKEIGDDGNDAAYRRRLSAATLFNAYNRALEDHAGKVFSEPIQVSPEAPPELVDWLRNVDLLGHSIDTYMPVFFADSEGDGISLNLTDKQELPVGTTLSEARATGMRPYWLHVRVDDLIGYRWEQTIAGPVLTQVRILERLQRDEGLYGTEDLEQVRVIDLKRGTFELHRRLSQSPGGGGSGGNTQGSVPSGQGSQALEVIEGEYPLPYIPLRDLRTRWRRADKQPLIADPYLQDMAEVNLAHTQIGSEQRTHLSYALRTFYHFSSVTPEEYQQFSAIGNAVALRTDPRSQGMSDAEVRVISVPTAPQDTAREELSRIERQLNQMGKTAILRSLPGSETATAVAIDTAEAEASLSDLAIRCQGMMNLAIEDMGAFEGEDWSGQDWLSIETDWAAARLAAQTADLLGLRQTNQSTGLPEISHETLIGELKRTNRLSDHIDPEEEVARIQEEQQAVDRMTDRSEDLVGQGATEAEAVRETLREEGVVEN